MTKEIFMVRKNPMDVKYKIAVLFPSLRRVSYRTLGYQIVYRMLNSYRDVLAERFTYDSVYSIESNTPLKEFDLVLVSSNFEMNYPYLAQIIRRSRIDPKRTKILVGGITTFNPGPLLGMGLYVTPSDAERIIPILYETSFDVDALVDEGLAISPDIMNKVKVLEAESIEHDYSRVQVLPASGKVKILLELTRGCPFRCRFCMYGNVRRKLLYKSIESVMEDISFWKRYYPARNVEIISSEPFSNPHVDEIVDCLMREGFYFSFPSIRVDRNYEHALEALDYVKNRTVTIAPEHSERIRRLLGKTFTNDEIIEFGKRLRKYKNINKIKLYLMTGIVEEDTNDLIEMKNLIEDLKRVSGKNVIYSINFLVPKPFAENLSVVSYENMETLLEIQKIIRKLFNTNVDPRKAYVQAIMSLGGPEVGRKILEDPINALKFSYWRKFIKEIGYDPVKEPWDYKKLIRLN
ncbi:MAG: radical SAM protein [Euryarchaeota archaeon]|nr:radical SAM protein [Euryarchaeota archaeon]